MNGANSKNSKYFFTSIEGGSTAEFGRVLSLHRPSPRDVSYQFQRTNSAGPHANRRLSAETECGLVTCQTYPANETQVNRAGECSPHSPGNGATSSTQTGRRCGIVWPCAKERNKRIGVFAIMRRCLKRVTLRAQRNLRRSS